MTGILLFNIFSTSLFVINSNQATAEVKHFFIYHKQSQQNLKHH